MSTPENPFDQTIRDPFDSSNAIEDPMHGPEAVAGLLAIPPMRKPDGTYHVFGGFYAIGTNTFDANGKPFIQFGSYVSDIEHLREAQALSDWVEAYHNGELPPSEEMEFPSFDLEARPYFVAPKLASASMGAADIGESTRDFLADLKKYEIPLTSIESHNVSIPDRLTGYESDQPQE